MGYRNDALRVYGEKCEICAYGLVEVHHIDYQEHQEVEDYIRYLHKNGNDVTNLVEEAKAMGYLEWSGWQLSKDDRTTNLACLCPTCHSFLHKVNYGKKVLRVLPPRK